MIKIQTISAYDIERIALFVVGEFQPDTDVNELIGRYLENIPGLESLSEKEIQHLIIIIESEVGKIKQLTKGD